MDELNREIKFDSVKVQGSDSIFFDADTIISTTIYLPVNGESTTSTFNFYTDSMDFFVELSYESQWTIFGEDCDPSLFISGLYTVAYNFDSLALINDILDADISENLEIHL